jgi:NAD(P)-dependent dehydrogenase (short-subunit alcohol dehydrogenase family)
MRAGGPSGRGARGYDVAGKVVVVTGAGRGIGLALTRLLHSRGATVVLIDADEAAVLRAAESLGERALALPVDVTDRPGMSAAIERIRERFGRVDVVVANAGVAPRPATLRTMEPADFDRVMGVNLTGVFNTVHPALGHIVRSGGHVVIVSSCAAFTPGMGGSPYMISKAGVEQLGRALRIELAAAGAGVSIVYLGVVDTAMTHDVLDRDELGRAVGKLLPWPLSRRITADDAAAAIAGGIARRAPVVIAPRAWAPYALLRGIVNAVLDRVLAGDARVHAVLRQIEDSEPPAESGARRR